ncbi:serine/threonine-protein kinase [Streptomyces sp. ME19-01-6]|uniref:serine/threonine-protein kinase n=1 Tax=Streptomyces sp. ME19-01-6 TaxID=3028686 RepID=UPI0029BD464D|nr:serine/threonine-protein kinase [Streptomyces sp. ME19-01-6]MDX3228563.1 serine/threonine-protein kinase [Streptomyces sp. ME19-01-6]
MAMMRLRREDPRVVGSFRLHRRLGAGGMGVVYLGSDRRGQRVALKVIRPDLAEDREFRSRFAREVSAARRIRGGCTARLVAADLEADRPWFATQYVPGPSLHDKVNEEGPLPAAQVAAIGSALAEGLLAVHEAGVVHRDLKPSNILLSPKGPRIIDFGIAWATGASTLTHVGTAVGSPGFLAPEQVRGATVTPATDVFALGATLAYTSMADSPFGQGSSEVMLYRVVHEEPHLAGVPDALAPLLHACLAKDPEDRPSTLQLSLRLKEIAAREAHGHGGHGHGSPERGHGGHGGLGGHSGPGGHGGLGPAGSGQSDGHHSGGQHPGGQHSGGHPSGGNHSGPRQPSERLSGRRADEYARQRTERRTGGTPAPAPRAQAPRASSPRPGPGPGTGGRSAGSAGSAGSTGRNSGARPTPARPPGRNGGARPPVRTLRTPPNGRRPIGPDRRLMRQRLIVFVVVTLLVALGIAAAQGCEGPPYGLGAPTPAPTTPSQGAAPPLFG